MDDAHLWPHTATCCALARRRASAASESPRRAPAVAVLATAVLRTAPAVPPASRPPATLMGASMGAGGSSVIHASAFMPLASSGGRGASATCRAGTSDAEGCGSCRCGGCVGRRRRAAARAAWADSSRSVICRSSSSRFERTASSSCCFCERARRSEVCAASAETCGSCDGWRDGRVLDSPRAAKRFHGAPATLPPPRW